MTTYNQQQLEKKSLTLSALIWTPPMDFRQGSALARHRPQVENLRSLVSVYLQQLPGV